MGKGGVPFGCGQCLPCRIKRRRQWVFRQFFESLMHGDSVFVTLTYDDEHLPAGGSLVPRDLQLALKRLRDRLKPRKFRFYGVGEYGDQSWRPHYHCSLFGVQRHEVVPRPRVQRGEEWIGPCPWWPAGNVSVAPFNETTAQYVCGYVVKKLTKPDDPRLPNGFAPEFARMSRRPGLGRDAMVAVAETLSRHPELIASTTKLRIGGRLVSLDRYLIRRLRIEAGLSDQEISDISAEAVGEQSQELSALLARAIAASPLAPVTRKEVYLREVQQKILQIETRSNIYSKKGSL